MSFRWLHLSDIHFEFNNYDTTRMRQMLVEYIKQLNIELDFLVITGDITYQGGEYDRVYDFLVRVVDQLKIKKLYMVPGNHDLKRDDMRTVLIESICKADDPIDKADNIDKKIYKYLISGQKKFFKFYKKILNKDYPEYDSHFVISEKDYNLIHINTCLLSGRDKEEGNLILPLTRLNSILSGVKGSNTVNIAIAHHSIECLDERIRDKFLNCLVYNNIDIYLCGHTHKPKATIDNSFEEPLNIFVCGAGIIDKYAYPYFAIGSSTDNSSIGITYHKWNKDIEMWTPANDISRKYKNGVIPININRLGSTNQLKQQIDEDKRSSIIDIDNVTEEKEVSHKIDIFTPSKRVTGNLIHIDNYITPEMITIHSELDSANCSQQTSEVCTLFNASFFRKFSNNILKDSSEYSLINEKFDLIMVLCDRIVLVFKDHQDYHQIGHLEECINELMNRVNNNCSVYDMIPYIISMVRNWMRLILYLVFPERSKHLHETSSLIDVVQQIDLFDGNFFNRQNTAEIESRDAVWKLMNSFLTKYEFFLFNGSRSIEETNNTILPAVSLLFIMPIYKYYDILVNSLSGSIIRPINLGNLEGLLKTVASERRGRLLNFKGREGFINNICNKLGGEFRDTGKYLLLTGREGTGKSAICAKVSDMFVRKVELLGGNANVIRATAPWLPAVILHFGKQSKKPYEILKFLVEQANSLLLRPINVPPTNELYKDDIKVWSRYKKYVKTFPIAVNQNISDSNYNTSDEKDYDYCGDNEIIHIKEDELNLKYSRVLYECLDQLVKERGFALLIIDAIDEISTDGKELSFLPQQLPTGVSALLTARSGRQVVNWVKGNFNVEEISVPPISREDISLITGVEDKVESGGKGFNDKVFKISSGWALLVSNVAKSVTEAGGDYSKARIEQNLDTILESQAAKWYIDEGIRESDLLVNVLALLVIFEPISPLDLNVIQDYLGYIGFELTLSDLRKQLNLVIDQIEGLDANRIKLSIEAFAGYVRDRHYSYRDLRKHLDVIVEWLTQSEEANYDLTIGFIKYWINPQNVNDKRYCTITETIITSLIKYKKNKCLLDLALYVWEEDASLLEIAHRCIRSSAELGNTRAMRILGDRLIDGDGILRDNREGEKWLYKSAELGDNGAMLILGDRLLFGKGMTINIDEGEKWLRLASKAEIKCALCKLGFYLIDRKDKQIEKDEGRKLVKKIVDSGEECILPKYSSYLIDGKGFERDAKYGKKLLRKLAVDGNTDAMGELGVRLIGGVGLERDIKEGAMWLKKSVELGNSTAMKDLGVRLLDGDTLNRNIKQGTMYLRKSADLGNTTALRELGKRYIEGKGLKKNIVEGIKQLRKSAELGNVRAMLDLGRYLIDGIGKHIDIDEGKVWITKAAETGSICARCQLGFMKIIGRGFEVNLEEGEKILFELAKCERGCMVDEVVVPLLNIREISISMVGKKLLIELAKLKNSTAMCELGLRLLTGNGLKQDEKAGLSWLEKSLLLGSDKAGVALGYHYYENNSIELAVHYFLGSFMLGNSAAGNNLAYMLRHDEIPNEINIPSISQLLKKGLEIRDPFALVNYALCIVKGFQFDVDWEKADKLISEIQYTDGIVEWWNTLASQNDSEGHLVIGWLVRHRLINDPDGLNISQRLSFVKDKCWDLPSWLFTIKD